MNDKGIIHLSMTEAFEIAVSLHRFFAAYSGFMFRATGGHEHYVNMFVPPI
jgi:hypothetical protein